METIEFNEVIKQNIEVVGKLLPEASYKSKGLCSTNIAKQKVDAWRGSSSARYIQIAKVLKSEVPNLMNQLLIEVISVFNYFAHFNVGICNTSNGVIAVCNAVKDNSQINFYYQDDGTYLYIYMTNLDCYISRRVLSAPSSKEGIGDIIKVDSIDTEMIITKN